MSIEALQILLDTYGPFVGITLGTFLIVDLALRELRRRRSGRSAVNARLRVLDENGGDRQQTLVELRRARGLSDTGGYLFNMHALNRLVVQSGVAINPARLAVMTAALGGAWLLAVLAVGGSPQFAILATLAITVALPLGSLLMMRSRRQRKLEEQLPDAIDVLVRSLKAGHPIPVSVALVAREVADPIGSEFGIVSDEMTYGLDLQTAMGNFRERTGQADIALLAVAVGIQAKTGGNLAELMSKLGRMIRERSRMRRKVKALSAEGRLSAIALSAVPAAVYLVISLRSPNFYAEVSGDPYYMPSFYVGLVLWMTGVAVMHRMVNFKI